MIRWYGHALLVALLAQGITALANNSSVSSRVTGDKEGRTSDLTCGPRCVQFVLGQYGVSEDLMPLIREIQWAELERGASLGQLRDALECRGIHTAMIRISPSSAIMADTPIILHGETNRGSGHFVVQQVLDGESVIWDGLRGFRKGWPDEVRSSGIALVTSRSPLTDTSWTVTDKFLWQKRVLILCCLAVVCWYVAGRRPAPQERTYREEPVSTQEQPVDAAVSGGD